MRWIFLLHAICLSFLLNPFAERAALADSTCGAWRRASAEQFAVTPLGTMAIYESPGQYLMLDKQQGNCVVLNGPPIKLTLVVNHNTDADNGGKRDVLTAQVALVRFGATPDLLIMLYRNASKYWEVDRSNSSYKSFHKKTPEQFNADLALDNKQFNQTYSRPYSTSVRQFWDDRFAVDPQTDSHCDTWNDHGNFKAKKEVVGGIKDGLFGVTVANYLINFASTSNPNAPSADNAPSFEVILTGGEQCALIQTSSAPDFMDAMNGNYMIVFNNDGRCQSQFPGFTGISFWQILAGSR